MGFADIVKRIEGIRWAARTAPSRARTAHLALTLFVLGMALAEACGFFGIFLRGNYKLDLVIASSLGIFQFIPFFARRFYR